METCKHCKRSIKNHVHDDGFYAGKMRCNPNDIPSNVYGYIAETKDEPCQSPCIGTRHS